MDQAELLEKIVGTLDALGISYMIVGSYGSSAWGEPRFTRDIDILVSLTSDDVDRLVQAFPFPEYYLGKEAVQDAILQCGQFNLIHPSSGVKADFILAGHDAWGRAQLSRRKKIKIESGLDVYIGAPEDIIIGKMIYYREGGSEKHLRDITGILKISGQDIDMAYIQKWVGDLGLSDIWESILDRVK
jgi:hypothetical protein